MKNTNVIMAIIISFSPIKGISKTTLELNHKQKKVECRIVEDYAKTITSMYQEEYSVKELSEILITDELGFKILESVSTKKIYRNGVEKDKEVERVGKIYFKACMELNS